MLKFNPFPIIEKNNFILRRMDYDDVQDLFTMRQDPKMNEYVDTIPDENTDATKAYIDKMNKGIDDNKWIIWAIEHKKEKKVIGTISIWNIDEKQTSGELGYGIIPDFQGQGLMKESLLSVIEYGQKIMKLREILAYTEENNIRSINLLKKCDFEVIKNIDEMGYYHNRVYRMLVFKKELCI
ncbi:MAG: acetyltransferase, family [Haloplasmataceae bacterium]|jgi:ribosomal-protein-alanine N-acetyltransferase|nr:acetyltransferase, family [Haloplasmataceae bacterium]